MRKITRIEYEPITYELNKLACPVSQICKQKIIYCI